MAIEAYEHVRKELEEIEQVDLVDWIEDQAKVEQQ